MIEKYNSCTVTISQLKGYVKEIKELLKENGRYTTSNFVDKIEEALWKIEDPWDYHNNLKGLNYSHVTDGLDIIKNVFRELKRNNDSLYNTWSNTFREFDMTIRHILSNAGYDTNEWV